MKLSTKKTIKYSAYILSSILLGPSAYELLKKEYLEALILFNSSLPILEVTYLGPKINEIEDKTDRCLEDRTKK